jgi:hypothetical protein
MTTPSFAPVLPAQTAVAAARPGSRAARMALPRAIDALKALASQYGVCTRPVLLRRTDLTTGVTEVIDLPCGATREDKCPACAKRGKRLRQVQIRDGWHRTDEPLPGPQPATRSPGGADRTARALRKRPRPRRTRLRLGPGRRPRRRDRRGGGSHHRRRATRPHRPTPAS